MPDDVVRVGVCGDDLEHLAVAELRRPVIGRLAAAAWIEAGAVERHGVLAHGDHTRLGVDDVARVEVKPFRLARYAGRPGAYLWPSASSHLR